MRTTMPMTGRLAAVVLTLAAACALAAGPAAATTGAASPGFTVMDASGKPVNLADFRGRFVVLEWTNPDCPFVRKHYDSGNMQNLQRAWGAKDVVWLAVNSTREGHGEFRDGSQMASWMKEQGGAPHAILIDGTSAAGRAYAAKTTPHMFVIDPTGRIVYQGAIDDRRSANPADAKVANNHVAAALTDAMAGRPVRLASTTPYGCSVKY